MNVPNRKSFAVAVLFVCVMAAASILNAIGTDTFPGHVVIIVSDEFEGTIVMLVNDHASPAGEFVSEVGANGIGSLGGPYPYHWWVSRESVAVQTRSGDVLDQFAKQDAKLEGHVVGWRNLGFLECGESGGGEWWIHIGSGRDFLAARSTFLSNLAASQRRGRDSGR